MNQYLSALLAVTLSASFVLAGDAEMWQQFQADQSLKGLDSEFEEKQAEPKVITKEKIIYKDRPVEIEKIVEVEKIVYKDRPEAQEPAVDNARQYNTLFVDISVPNDPTFISDFLKLTERASGLDWRKIEKMMLTAPDRGPYTITVSGQIELPEEINSDRIYIKPIVGRMTSNLKVDGMAWNTTEMNVLNSYKKTNTLPYNYSWTSSSYENPKGFMQDVKASLTTMRFLVSNKPVERGDKKDFMPARIFINP